MKVKALGAKRVYGLSKADKDFDIPSLLVIIPIENSPTGGRVVVQGAGCEIVEMPILPNAFNEFLGLSYPCDLVLKMESVARYGKFESVAVGFIPATKPAIA